MDKKPKFVYSSIELDEESRNRLLNYFNDKIPYGWKRIAHHMTIKLGFLPDDLKPDIGKKINLVVFSLGKSDKAIACGVSGYPSDNEKPHVTLAINELKGGRPKDSNKIPNWYPLVKQLKISGIVKENILY